MAMLWKLYMVNIHYIKDGFCTSKTKYRYNVYLSKIVFTTKLLSVKILTFSWFLDEEKNSNYTIDLSVLCATQFHITWCVSSFHRQTIMFLLVSFYIVLGRCVNKTRTLHTYLGTLITTSNGLILGNISHPCVIRGVYGLIVPMRMQLWTI